MIKTQKGSWTEDDVDRLRRHIERGGSAGTAAVRFKRTEQAVKAQARVMGMKFLTIKERRSRVFGTTRVMDDFSDRG